LIRKRISVILPYERCFPSLATFKVPAGKEGEKIDLEIPLSRSEEVFLTRDNYYGADTVLFNLTFRDQAEKSFTLRFAPITLIPRRRIALQRKWFDYLTKAMRRE
jgi:hypothetical protein